MANTTIFDHRQELINDLTRLQNEIDDDYRAYIDDDEPGIQVTIACTDDATEFALQSGDNSYTGTAYSFPHWAVSAIYRDSDLEDLADELFRQLEELLPC